MTGWKGCKSTRQTSDEESGSLRTAAAVRKRCIQKLPRDAFARGSFLTSVKNHGPSSAAAQAPPLQGPVWYGNSKCSVTNSTRMSGLRGIAQQVREYNHCSGGACAAIKDGKTAVREEYSVGAAGLAVRPKTESVLSGGAGAAATRFCLVWQFKMLRCTLCADVRFEGHCSTGTWMQSHQRHHKHNRCSGGACAAIKLGKPLSGRGVSRWNIMSCRLSENMIGACAAMSSLIRSLTLCKTPYK